MHGRTGSFQWSPLAPRDPTGSGKHPLDINPQERGHISTGPGRSRAQQGRTVAPGCPLHWQKHPLTGAIWKLSAPAAGRGTQRPHVRRGLAQVTDRDRGHTGWRPRAGTRSSPAQKHPPRPRCPCPERRLPVPGLWGGRPAVTSLLCVHIHTPHTQDPKTFSRASHMPRGHPAGIASDPLPRFTLQASRVASPATSQAVGWLGGRPGGG